MIQYVELWDCQIRDMYNMATTNPEIDLEHQPFAGTHHDYTSPILPI